MGENHDGLPVSILLTAGLPGPKGTAPSTDQRITQNSVSYGTSSTLPKGAKRQVSKSKAEEPIDHLEPDVMSHSSVE